MHFFSSIKQKNRGFTLIELLVVIAVMGVLATIVLVAVNPDAQLAKIRDTQRKSDIQSIKRALESYYVARGSYPVTGTANIYAWVYSTGSSTWIPGLDSVMTKIPRDPVNNAAGPWSTSTDNYSYAYASNGECYNLVARLENTADPDICSLNDYQFITSLVQCSGNTASDWCGGYSGQIYSTTNRDN